MISEALQARSRAALMASQPLVALTHPPQDNELIVQVAFTMHDDGTPEPFLLTLGELRQRLADSRTAVEDALLDIYVDGADVPAAHAAATEQLDVLADLLETMTRALASLQRLHAGDPTPQTADLQERLQRLQARAKDHDSVQVPCDHAQVQLATLAILDSHPELDDDVRDRSRALCWHTLDTAVREAEHADARVNGPGCSAAP